MHEDMNMRGRWGWRVLKIALIGVAAIALAGFVVMSLWNWLAPDVLGAHTITFWQALGILVLSKLLFGGFRGRPGCRDGWKDRWHGRWEHMTPEEREKFREGMAACWGRGARPAARPGEPASL